MRSRQATMLRRTIFVSCMAAFGSLSPTSALAVQEAEDRQEFDRAAGRAVFSNVPIAESRPFAVEARAQQPSNSPPSNRPAVRVILASPYGR